jgi:hypothetical protein
MPKNPSNDLFLLIKSLSGSEKVHLVKNVLKKGSKEPFYFRLYNLIVKQDEYDELPILKSFAGMNQTALSDKKYQLYNLIVNSLSERQKSTEAELRKMLNRIEFLYGKLLYDQAYEIVKKGQDLCNKHEYFMHLLLFAEWEHYIQTTLILDDKSKNKKAEDLLKGMDTAIKKIKSFHEYHSLYRHIQRQERTAFFRPGPKENDPFDALINNPLLLTPPPADATNLVKIYYYLCLNSFYTKNDDLQKVVLYIDKAISIFEKNESLKAENPFDYLGALTKKCAASLAADDIREQEKALKKIINFNSLSTLAARQYHFGLSYLNLLRNYLYKAEFIKAIPIIDECKNKLKREELNLKAYHLIYLHFHFFLVYFGAGSFRNADKELAHINNQLKTENYALDMQAFSRILSVIVCYEKKEFVILSSLSRSAYRFLEKRKILGGFEKILLKSIDKSVYINSPKEQMEHFILLKENLLRSVDEEYISYACGYFDFISWIDSKITNKKFAEVVKSKAVLRPSQK